jgi:hypothetical protein
MDVFRTGARRRDVGTILLVGIALGASPMARGADAPTYHHDVAPIVQKHCQDCHRPGQVAPFSLLDYAQARKRADDIAAVTAQRSMPPWHASTIEGGRSAAHGC